MQHLIWVVEDLFGNATSGFGLLLVGTDIQFQLLADLQHLDLGHRIEDGGKAVVGGEGLIFDEDGHEEFGKVESLEFRAVVKCLGYRLLRVAGLNHNDNDDLNVT